MLATTRGVGVRELGRWCEKGDFIAQMQKIGIRPGLRPACSASGESAWFLGKCVRTAVYSVLRLNVKSAPSPDMLSCRARSPIGTQIGRLDLLVRRFWRTASFAQNLDIHHNTHYRLLRHRYPVSCRQIQAQAHRSGTSHWRHSKPHRPPVTSKRNSTIEHAGLNSSSAWGPHSNCACEAPMQQ